MIIEGDDGSEVVFRNGQTTVRGVFLCDCCGKLIGTDESRSGGGACEECVASGAVGMQNMPNLKAAT